MMLPGVLSAFRALASYRGLTGRLPGRGRELTVTGVPGSAGAVLVAALARDTPHRAALVVAPSPGDAERWVADLRVLAGDAVRLYPQREALGEEEPHYELAGERVETLEALLSGRARLIVTTLRATAERTRMPAALAAARLDVAAGQSVGLSDVVSRLSRLGYERRPVVTDVAQFAVRGGLIDVYGFGMDSPARIEWSGDVVAALRQFDLDTQRSTVEIDRVVALPVKAGEVEAADVPPLSDNLLDLLPPDTLIVAAQGLRPEEIQRAWGEAEHLVEVARRRGEDVPGRHVLLLDPGDWSVRWDRFPRLILTEGTADHDLRIFAPEPIDRDLKRLRSVIAAGPTLILCDNEGQLERLEELVSIGEGPVPRLPSGLTLALGALQGGFVLPGLTILTDHEIFRRARRIRRARRYRQATTASASLAPGDYVVHMEHGIGIYRGVEQIAVEVGAFEVAVVEYEGGDRLNVPLYRIDQIDRYAAPDEGGGSAAPPRLDRLGGARWTRQREKTQRAIHAMAAELLDLYARRTVAPGYGFPPDTRWQRELESSFLYEDTPDQRTATADVKRDMERPVPMDRLIVGDVGYGKTEIAVRAAFKAVQGGKQVAVLVPTTILAEQHGRVFSERMADFPVRIEVLSRFRTAREQVQVVRDLNEGKVDVVIGTHRVLSSDVRFRELGLVIVDEEHRFGVKHKDRLKELRLEVDVLTLTATPIPRTLHQTFAGLRDLTLIETPPRDRSPVLTFVEPWDDALLEEAIARELDRGGQVYVVHNRIETIATIAARIAALTPRARIAVAHGQMRERALEEVMRGFVAGEVDVLVSTMIVESGLDVPNANTMIVHRADQFGVAQLYQLRGRVGRGHRRAYCYLLVPEVVDPEAEARLKILEHHTALGSGYRIALRDLELRGAGNLLGAEQSGHAHAVGLEVYLRWLDEAVRGLAGADRAVSPPEVTVDGAARLPDEYVPDEGLKLDLYRRLARAREPGEIAVLRDELRDRFGPLPADAERLLLVAELRALGARMGLETVLIRGDEARLGFRANASPRLAALTTALDEVQFAADVRRTKPLALHLRRLGGLSIGSGLVRALSVATVTAAPAGAGTS